jgi:hypothetical protein
MMFSECKVSRQLKREGGETGGSGDNRQKYMRILKLLWLMFVLQHWPYSEESRGEEMPSKGKSAGTNLSAE